MLLYPRFKILKRLKFIIMCGIHSALSENDVVMLPLAYVEVSPVVKL